MGERPIIFSAPMVKAILAGRKSQTRRIAEVRRMRVRLSKSVSPDFPELTSCPKAKAGVHPISMNQHGAVSAILGGDWLGLKPSEFSWVSPYGEPGDRLWVRETWAPWSEHIEEFGEEYALEEAKKQMPWANIEFRENNYCSHARVSRWRPAIFMPRWASRITLEVTGVRVERLQAITEADARAEGTERHACGALKYSHPGCCGHVRAFELGWDTINAKRGSWASNPWVWVIEFRRAK